MNTIPKEAWDAMCSAPDEAIASIEESVFVKRWLPMFYGSWRTADGTVPIGTWIKDVAKGHMLPVRVTRNGKELYRIPPILGQSIIVKDPAGYLSASDALDQMRAHNARFPGSGDKYLKGYAEQLRPFDEEENEERNAFWGALFIHYGLDKSSEAKNIKKDIPEEDQQQLSSDDDFDDDEGY